MQRAADENGYMMMRYDEASVGRVLLLAALFAAVHSALASRQMKDFATRIAGVRYRSGLYRLLYSVLAYLMFVWAVVSYYRLPDRPLYQVPAPFSWLMRLGQVASLLMVLECIRVMGFRQGFGIASVTALWRGEIPEPEPESQGPRLDHDGELLVTGPYRYSRHPVNLAAFGIVWLHPRMSVNWLTIAIVASVYAIVGSFHEESRLLRIYGDRYVRYQRTVPFMFPRVRGKRPGPYCADMRAEARR
jgi:methanethiol S-methyltransferase